ncbi:hypothetical protein BDM02DRAFT_3119422 [Thelephora ganbajun]|uniref:Uncharacterized protein n=1 Tax=Thelephora ganbajun TaxID=370292 RepID=A0ACB6Z9B4_THEGA|nr:hypothetical protein BDM02DRAFT_3119422 [Thelephora ganbajun]
MESMDGGRDSPESLHQPKDRCLTHVEFASVVSEYTKALASDLQGVFSYFDLVTISLPFRMLCDHPLTVNQPFLSYIPVSCSYKLQ